MDAQQQIVALLEGELQKSILGGTATTVDTLKASVATIYGTINSPDQTGYKAGDQWTAAINDANSEFPGASAVDQDYLRQMLYQARALLGELRIEEQAWNGEVNSEKTLRKDVNDFAKV